jgi:hypothetical protein
VDKATLDRFFTDLNQFLDDYLFWTGEFPSTLIMNPDIIGKLSRVEGFYQRKELESLVPAHAPVVRFFRLQPSEGEPVIVQIYEDWEEKFLHFE